ncbi:MAG TPA: nickel pincer cofactor biosynthesis protein LarB [Acidimicrobiales bacterium]|nr:nickel pincer cofactor biosynthesis protein LarB [Acidimicrobiales bacterium]
MDELDLNLLLRRVRDGSVAVDDAAASLRRLPFADLGFARIDHHRVLRQGLPEAVYAPGKSAAQCAAIVRELLDHDDGPVLLTRASEAQIAAALAVDGSGEVFPAGRPIESYAVVSWRASKPSGGSALIVTAGTADLPVAHECEATLAAYGIEPTLLADCGVAGLHRLLSSMDELSHADAVVVIAGMEGALASVVGGLTAAPVVAVPTSVGYGAGLEGVTALLAMHASCAAGVVVVGIDNGYGAACAVARMLR